MRESLFNVLAARLDFTGLSVLDLYAGSGALGLEALSRGAVGAVLVESDQRACTVIAQNIAALGLPGATVRRGAVNSVLAAEAPEPVDLVFADPPYDVETAELERMLRVLVENRWAAPGTVVVVERSTASAPIDWPPEWEPWRDRRYGDTRVEMAEVL
ncbi:16S rRNA (guanine(966)-N(2))-methyltransferase RsmD [soil metagenome]